MCRELYSWPWTRPKTTNPLRWNYMAVLTYTGLKHTQWALGRPQPLTLCHMMPRRLTSNKPGLYGTVTNRQVGPLDQGRTAIGLVSPFPRTFYHRLRESTMEKSSTKFMDESGRDICFNVTQGRRFHFRWTQYETSTYPNLQCLLINPHRNKLVVVALPATWSTVQM